jgi:hypothetical protein
MDTNDNITPTEKRMCLFNVNEPIELPIEEFEKSWWPLVTNIWTQYNSYKFVNGDSWKIYVCRLAKHRESSTRQEGISIDRRRQTSARPSDLCNAKIKITWLMSSEVVQIERYKDSPDHTHPIQDIDRIKRPQVVRDLVEQEARKNYPSPAIVSAVKEYGTDNLSLGSSVQELKRKEVTNIKHKVRGAMETNLVGSDNIESDIFEAKSHLENQGYQVNHFHVSSHSTQGLVFVHPAQLTKLRNHGWLTLVDSTHKTNKYDWRLFTLYIRDSYGCWDVGAHFFVSREDGDTVAEAIRIVRSNCQHWMPRYVLMDQSNIEANAFKKAFPGLQAGEQECETIFCTVHTMRTWMRRIYEKTVRDKMVMAMHKTTKIGCERLVAEAINQSSIPDIQSYIQRNYQKNTQQWALWARQCSPLLLQTTSTNPLESYHSELKKRTSPTHGLIGTVYMLITVTSNRKYK